MESFLNVPYFYRHCYGNLCTKDINYTHNRNIYSVNIRFCLLDSTNIQRFSYNPTIIADFLRKKSEICDFLV